MAAPPASLLASLPGCAALDAEALEALRATARVQEVEAGAPLIGEGEPAPDWYAVVESGALRVSGREPDGLGTLDELGPGDVVDPGPPGEPVAWSATAIEPTRCLLVPRAAVAARRGRLLETPPGPDAGDVALLAGPVGDLVKQPPVTCAPDTSIGVAARRMAERGVGSIVVAGGDGRPLGIVTDRDLRNRVVAAERSPGDPVSAVMSAPLVTIEAAAPGWEALLEMTRRHLHHLGVVDRGRLAGVVSATDIAQVQGGHPVTLAREIDTQASIEGLAAAAPRVHAVVRWLVGAGTAVAQIGRIVAELNDRLVRRAVALSEAGLRADGHGGAPVAYSWIAAGSEGRREQTLKTDQDNGLVFDDPPGDAAARAAAAWFARLAARAGDALERLGFPACPGGYMARNPRWCQPASAWRAQFEAWMDTPQPEAVLHASTFLDLRGVAGDAAPAAALRGWLTERTAGRVLFVRHLARDAVARRPPLGLFGGFVVERSGVHKDRLDLKARGIFPVTQAARVHALALGVPETGTLDRLAGASAHGVVTAAELGDLADAWEVLGRLRLRHQLACLAAGAEPDNHIDPALLGKADRLLLKEAFRTVEWLQSSIEERFQTATVM
jgi:CBS domain-containing protein